MGRYGSEPAAEALPPGYWPSGGLHHFGVNILIFLPVLAIKPVAAASLVLRRDHELVYLAQAALERRYGRAWYGCDDARSPGGAC
jgi:hypothetical protein